MPDLIENSAAISTVVFFLAAAFIAWAGTKLARLADELADVTGLGEAVAGAVLLGGVTSIAGVVVSVSAAWAGRGELAAANAIGGITVQTFFLAIADAFHKEANLEHAAASHEHTLQATLLVSLLAVPMIAALAPEVTLWAIHPATALMLLMYLHGMRTVRIGRKEPMWRPERTRETREDIPDQSPHESVTRLLVKFAIFGAGVGAAGWVVMRTAVVMAQAAGLSESIAGEVFTAISTSLPELVTSVAAVRRGALVLAVGGIIGGNAFDTLFLAFADIAYRGGSLYHVMTGRQIFSISVAILMTTLILTGLLRREKKGLANIGFESVAVIVLYAFSIGMSFAMEF